jgi:hypothetical protein
VKRRERRGHALSLLLCAWVQPLAAATPAAAVPAPARLHLALRTGFGVPFGSYARVRQTATFSDTQVNRIGDDTHGVIPLWVDVGYRFSPQLMAGIYFMYGLVLPKRAPESDPLGGGCPDGVDCFANGIRFGVQAQYSFAPGSFASPWLGLGLGYERISSQLKGQLLGFRIDSSSTHGGPELLHLQAGVDLQPAPQLRIGPFGAISGMRYTRCSAELAGETVACRVSEGAWHGWVMVGVRGALEL